MLITVCFALPILQDGTQTIEINDGEENPEETSSDAMKKLADIYPDKSQSELHSALTITNGNAEEAVHLLLDVEDTKPNDIPSSSTTSTDNGLLLITSYDEPVHVILMNFASNAIDADNDIWVDVNRDDVWCICLGFYKTALKHPERLAKNLCVKFVGSGEMGIDVGALRNEFFSLCLDEAIKRLFEGDLALIPRRGIGSKGIQFEVVGAMIAHSVSQGGPGFPFLAEWVVHYLLGEDPSNLIISKEYISQSEVTSTPLELIEKLDKVQTPEALNYVLEVHVKHNSFWEVINASEWSSTEVITIENKGYLVHELIFNELVRRRKDQLDSLSRGLQMLGFLSLLKRHRKVADHVLSYHALEINA